MQKSFKPITFVESDKPWEDDVVKYSNQYNDLEKRVVDLNIKAAELTQIDNPNEFNTKFIEYNTEANKLNQERKSFNMTMYMSRENKTVYTKSVDALRTNPDKFDVVESEKNLSIYSNPSQKPQLMEEAGGIS